MAEQGDVFEWSDDEEPVSFVGASTDPALGHLGGEVGRQGAADQQP